MGQNGILREAVVKATVGEKNWEERWFSFATVKRAGTKLLIEPTQTARPLLINGGGANSEFVTFAQTSKDCEQSDSTSCNQAEDYIADIDFLRQISNEKKIKLLFAAKEFHSGANLFSECKVIVTIDLLTKLAENEWYAARCISG